MKTIEKINVEDLNELSKEASENLEEVSPVELPANEAADIKSEISFTGETVNVCVCGCDPPWAFVLPPVVL